MERSSNDPDLELVSLAVVFDLGGVLARPTDPARLARMLGAEVDVSVFTKAYWAQRDAYDLGLSDTDYWSAVAAASGTSLAPGSAESLARVDAQERTTLAEDARLFIEDLHRLGFRLGLLSNAPLVLAEAVERCAWSGIFERLLFSAREGLAKPHPAVYRRATALLDLPPARIVFFDDRPVNVEAARRHGWAAHVWTGASDARAILAGLGPLTARSRLVPEVDQV